MSRLQAVVAPPAVNAAPRARAKARPAQPKDARKAPGRYSLESVRWFPAPEPEGRVERIELPHRAMLEDVFGCPLDHVVALTGVPVARWLDGLNAEAASVGRYILLPDTQPAVETVAHEVVHTMQSEGAIVPADAVNLLEPGSPAEAEAERRAAEPSAAAVGETLPANVLALRREGIPSTPSPAPPEPEEKLAKGLEKPGAEPAPAEEKTEVVGPAAEAPPATEAAPGARAAAEEQPQPTFEPPAMPETALSPDEQAQRQKQLAEAQAAIEQAEDPAGVVDAFAEAPPSVKAAMQSTIGDRVQQAAETEQQEFSSNLPEFHASMSGEVAVEETAEVQPPAAAPVALEEAPPEPAPAPELPPTPAPEPFQENEGVVGFLSRLFGGDPADAIGRSLSEVQTSDPNIETSPGEAPAVPLEGETDPERLEDQNQASAEEARRLRDEASQVVLEGRGPEAVQPREMDEPVPLGEQPVPQTSGFTPAEGAERLNQMALPEEVLVQFDQDTGAAMAANLGEAHAQFSQAQTDRDSQREEAVSQAEAEQQRLTEEADQQQRTEVLDARETVQQHRQDSIDAQAQAVADLEDEAETERAAADKSIEDRVAEDEGQIDDRYTQAETEAETEVQQGERDAEVERANAEQQAEEESWWDKAVDFVKSAFAALTAAINSIFDAVRAAIKTALDAARDFAKGLIDAAAGFIKDAIEAYGAALKGLIDITVGQVFPEIAATLNAGIDTAVETATAAVDAVAETLKSGVDSLVDSLNAALNKILDLYQGAINTALAIVGAVLTGDWAAAARMALEAILRILGVDPAEFYAFIGNAMETIEIIVNDPLGFLSHLLDAVVLGFQQFASNFFTHLQAGIIGWLTGALGDIQIPEHFDLAGVLDLARQILGLTWDWLREKAVRLIGEQNVERLEFILSYVQTLIEGGFPALFERIMQDLSGLVDTVLGAISEFLVEKVIIAGITWLASLFSPVGAVVKLIFTIWNLYTFLRDQFARMIRVVQTVVEGISNIAHGVIGGAATRIEEVLANLLPIGIDLVAKLLGLTGVAARVREIISDIRARIDAAVNSLLDKVLKTFRSGGQTAADEEAAAAGATGEIGESLTVEAEGEPPHTLFIGVTGTEATVMLASDALPVSKWLDGFDEQVVDLPEEQKAATTKQITDARDLVRRLDAAGDAAAAESAGGTPPVPEEVFKMERDLQFALQQLFKQFGGKGKFILDIFKDQIAAAHPTVQESLKRTLRENQAKFQAKSWEGIRAELLEIEGPFASPMRQSHPFGQLAQAAAKGFIPAGAVAPQEEANFLSNWVANKVDSGKDVDGGKDKLFEAARDALRTILFEGGDPSTSSALSAAVQAALALFDARGDKADLLLVEKVSGKIIQFLTAVAMDASDFNGLPLGDKWDSDYWGNPANREWIMQRFRGGSGEHEWIPTDYVGRVIDRARTAKETEGAPSAALWVTFHDTFRSPTRVLIFPPTGDFVKTVDQIRDPITHVTKKSGTFPVLQGHVGAIYAPVGDDEYRDDVVQQTKGQQGWHDELRKIFESNFGVASTKAGIGKIISDVDEFRIGNVWDGAKPAVSEPAFNEYYTAAKKTSDGSDMVKVDDLRKRASGAAGQIENDFKKARSAVGL